MELFRDLPVPFVPFSLPLCLSACRYYAAHTPIKPSKLRYSLISSPHYAMNGTPRLRSAFPQTPQTIRRTRDPYATPLSSKSHPPREPKSPSRELQQNPQDARSPLIPVQLIDAPSQRFYIFGFYVVLNAWRVYEAWSASDELDSTWLFLKWIAVDGIFLFGLQALRIPWLEWAFPTTLAIFLLHTVGNVFLMFSIPVCGTTDSVF